MPLFSRLKTPGVYIQEITAPLSVAQVETAIPAFIGYTEKAPSKNSPVKINSMLDFEAHFGNAQPEKIHLNVSSVAGVPEVSLPTIHPKYVMHYQMQMFFANGGGACYTVSVGNFSRFRKSKTALLAGLRSLEGVDEITLIVFADVPASGHIDLNKAALSQAGRTGDRFAILDVPNHQTDPIGEFRNNIGTENLSYGAAYYPKLISVLTPFYDDESVHIDFAGTEHHGKTLADVALADAALHALLKKKLQTALQSQALVLFPSASIAGVFAQVDMSRGVWKAPANVGLSLVVAPEINITHQMQEGLNVDPVTGKSINAIRTFTGVGVMVWGARTLAGNDNEWRYISVRRFIISVEESVRKAIVPFVFEPNDANTWLNVQAMVENYLTGKWREGALAGAKPEDAFFVKVGLNQTMTAQDVLEGRMILEIGLAVVRPAEFIMVRLTQTMAV